MGPRAETKRRDRERVIGDEGDVTTSLETATAARLLGRGVGAVQHRAVGRRPQFETGVEGAEAEVVVLLTGQRTESAESSEIVPADRQVARTDIGEVERDGGVEAASLVGPPVARGEGQRRMVVVDRQDRTHHEAPVIGVSRGMGCDDMLVGREDVVVDEQEQVAGRCVGSGVASRSRPAGAADHHATVEPVAEHLEQRLLALERTVGRDDDLHLASIVLTVQRVDQGPQLRATTVGGDDHRDRRGR